jgi:hypothetical protein
MDAIYSRINALRPSKTRPKPFVLGKGNAKRIQEEATLSRLSPTHITECR